MPCGLRKGAGGGALAGLAAAAFFAAVGAGFRGVAALAAAGALDREAGFFAVLAAGREAEFF